jgi:hypothetical protein
MLTHREGIARRSTPGDEERGELNMLYPGPAPPSPSLSLSLSLSHPSLFDSHLPQTELEFVCCLD